MVSFLSFPWNGSDPVSISNCKGTQDRESACSDGREAAAESSRQPNATRSFPAQWDAGIAALLGEHQRAELLMEVTWGGCGETIKAVNKSTLW